MKILAICGSTRKNSSNLNLIKAFATLTKDIFDVSIYTSLAELPQFNPDLDLEGAVPPAAVADFRRQVREADGVLICTPEYAVGVPGALKNAIDWTVSSMDFSKKPVALITAGTSGVNAHRSLLGTLLIIESRITAAMQVVVSSVKTKINEQCEITDNATLAQLRALIAALADLIQHSEEEREFLQPPAFY
ncbi:NADPH-dependent FMN reductase [Chitinophaga vietnamensis]|uniref:NADPH-dependent FMN reductase n=1 Tax=Chitinophaga vietnamensis TaxID=2593957 RepID=UPI0011777CA8|nr:NADPH-dependent FMN reductase [Chitinophaga vietnamensis]